MQNSGDPLKMWSPEQLKMFSDEIAQKMQEYSLVQNPRMPAAAATATATIPAAPATKAAKFEDNFPPEYTDKNTVHSYLPVYEQLLRPFITSQAPFRMLEVGIQRGGSILGWCKTFPNATVIGVDCMKQANLTFPNYKEIITNAYTDEFLEMMQGGTLDFIVEDGSHAYNDLIFVCKNYTKLLKKGGVLVIEDIPDVAWIPKLLKAFPEGVQTQVVDLREKKKRWDDVLILVKRT
jgi:predicted O-methyltransferase YrrM